jgi:hypothetical protein
VTVLTAIIIRCQSPACEGAYVHPIAPADLRPERDSNGYGAARGAAKATGWAYGDSSDWCPTHAPSTDTLF